MKSREPDNLKFDFTIPKEIRKMALELAKQRKVTQEYFKEFQEKIEKAASLFYFDRFEDRLKKFLDGLPDKTKDSFKNLGSHGWYPDLKLMRLSDFPKLSALLDEGKSSKVDIYLSKYFNRNVNYIRDAIIKKFPKRKKVISEGFDAHKKKLYFCSISLLVSQAEGLSNDVLGRSPYRTKNGETDVKEKFESMDHLSDFTLALATPLIFESAISASSGQLKNYPVQDLSRHEILHGKLINYGTKLNSFKSISYINYVSQFLSILIDEKKD